MQFLHRYFLLNYVIQKNKNNVNEKNQAIEIYHDSIPTKPPQHQMNGLCSNTLHNVRKHTNSCVLLDYKRPHYSLKKVDGSSCIVD